MNTKHEPLRVEFMLTRPLCVPEFPIHLDALLAWARVMEEEDAGHESPWSAQEDLPLATYGEGEDRVWCASTLMWEALEPPWPIVRTKRFELDDLAIRQGRVYAKGPNRFTPGTGPYKAFVMNTPVVWVDKVVAYAIGDPAAIRRLLGRIENIGKHAKLGFGAVSCYEVVPDDTAADAWAWRTLPEERAGYAKVEATIRPPYWNRETRRVAYRPVEIPKEVLHV